MIASILHLTRRDIKVLRITDPYSLHRVVFSLFDDIRSETEKKSDKSSGILYADKGGDFNSRKILILSSRSPRSLECGVLRSKIVPENFLMHEHYTFEVILNPSKRSKTSGKIEPILGREAIMLWFINKSSNSWGFKVKKESLQVKNISVNKFDKKNHTITQSSATLIGHLTVENRTKFIKSFQLGIGRGRAFGFGLLQIVPFPNRNFHF